MYVYIYAYIYCIYGHGMQWQRIDAGLWSSSSVSDLGVCFLLGSGLELEPGPEPGIKNQADPYRIGSACRHSTLPRPKCLRFNIEGQVSRKPKGSLRLCIRWKPKTHEPQTLNPKPKSPSRPPPSREFVEPKDSPTPEVLSPTPSLL